MSGLYNMLFGLNRAAVPLLKVLNVDHTTVPRFRDCFLNEAGTEIIIYTRSGGGNRDEYAELNRMMMEIPGYLRDEDDSYDNTYALFYYEIPEQHRETCLMLANLGLGVDQPKRWADYIAKIGQDQ